MAASLGKDLPQTLPPASDDNQRRPAQAWGRAHSTARWIRAADLSGGRGERERRRLKRNMTESRAALAGSPRGCKPSLSFKINGNAFCLLLSPAPNILA